MRYVTTFMPLLLLSLGSFLFANDTKDGVVAYKGLYWQVEEQPRFYTHKEAVQSCESLNIHTNERNDINKGEQWRLPNIKEIAELSSAEVAYTAQKQDFVKLSNEFYWSSTDYADVEYSKLILNFATGNKFWRLDDDKAYRICVKGDERYLYSDLNSSYNVTQNTQDYERFTSSTLGLTWHQSKKPNKMVYKEAKQYCEKLPYNKGILDDWNHNNNLGNTPDIVGNRPTVYFDLNIDSPSKSEHSKLVYIASIIPETSKVTLYCHTDRKYTSEYNIDLSKRRCEATASIFVKHGISRDRIVFIPMGESQPLIATEDDMNEPANRRVEIEFAQNTNPIENPWRLPTIDDLHSLVFIHENHITLDRPKTSNEYERLWSSTPTAYEKNKYWIMGVKNTQGLDYAINEWEKTNVICVH
ncbi:DUF1566 domain-containing protein [bacterium]|nr:DUF1566 domain-containing protein [bacterium]MBU1994273.1 DUF1566 domain-containing protein [bacterium]